MSKSTSKNYRKFIIGAAAVAIVAPMVAPVASLAAVTFPDVEGSYIPAVEFLQTKGIQGKLDGTFGTHENITRQDAAIFVAKALELDTEKAPNAGFTDVNPRAVGAVNALKAEGITKGKSATTFGGGDLITRGELAKWIAAAFDLQAGNDATNPFSDVEGHYIDAVKALVENEVTLGKTATTFGTHENATRGQFALFVYRAANIEKVQVSPAVENINALNAKQIKVEFNTALKKGTTSAQLVAAFSLDNVEITKADLSEDRKSVVYTLSNTEVDNATLTVKPLNTDLKDDKDQTIQTAKYVTVFSFDDVVAPSVVETTYAGYNQAGTIADATISFNEEVLTVGTVSVNGVERPLNQAVTTSNSFTLAGLEVGKTYTIDIVGAKDTATPANKAEHLTLSFTVPAKEVDATIPTVSTSTNGNKLTLNFSEEVTKGKVSIGGTEVAAADITTIDNKSFVIDVQKANAGAFFATNTNFFKAEVVVKGFKDSEPNEMEEVKFNSNFTADVTAPSISSAKALEDGKIVLEFSEEVKEDSIKSLTVKTIDGITQTSGALAVESASHPVVDGEEVANKLELSLTGKELQVGKKYVIELAKDKVEDLYGNANDKVINFSVTRPESADAEAGEVITTEMVEESNVINITFANTDEDGMTDSVLKPSNYTVGGKVLPANTDIQFIDDKNHVRITLPEAFVTVNGKFTFVASNLEDQYGNTLTKGENTQEFDLTENIAPTVNETLTLNGSNTVIVSFSEAVKSVDLDEDKTLLEGITVKVNGTTAVSQNSVEDGKLKVSLTDAVTTSDKITVDFDKAELTDANNNQVKNGTASN